MTQINGNPANPTAKNNRQQRRQAARQAGRQARKATSKANGRNGAAKEPDHGIARDLKRAHEFHLAEDYEAASELYQRVLARQPENYDAMLWLGVLANKAGDATSAVRILTHSLRFDPDNPTALAVLGNSMRTLGRPEEGLALCRRALELDSACIDAWTAMGAILQSMGQFEQANATFESAIALDPTHGPPYASLASSGKIQADSNLIERMERVLAENDLPDKRRSVFEFALGKCFGDLGDYDAAFAHYRRANVLSGKGASFDEAKVEDRFDRLIATFTRDFLAQRATMGSDSQRPVFIVGMPRSGTTLVERIIASHPDSFGTGERMKIADTVRDLSKTLQTTTPYPECATQIDAAVTQRLAASYLEDLQQRSGVASRVTDKMPNNFQHLGIIALLFPNARIINCRRDPIDTCLSCYCLDFSGRLNFAYDLTHLGQYYRQYERLMAHWRVALPNTILDVRYEDLVADPETETRRIIDHCRLEWNDACLTHDKADGAVMSASNWQVRQPIYKTSVERWRRYEKHLGPLIQALKGNGTDATHGGDTTTETECNARPGVLR